MITCSSKVVPIADPGGGARGPCPAGIVKINKKMATKGGHIDFMFLGPSTWSLDPLLCAMNRNHAFQFGYFPLQTLSRPL